MVTILQIIEYTESDFIKPLPNNLAISIVYEKRKELEDISQTYKAISVMAAKKLLNRII